MFMRAVIFRIVYVGIVSVGILLSAALRQSTVQAAPVVAAKQQTHTAAIIPTVTLATIHVRPATVRAAVKEVPPLRTAAVGHAAQLPSVAEGRAGASLPTLRLDMPYYSFGKLLPRVGKE